MEVELAVLKSLLERVDEFAEGRRANRKLFGARNLVRETTVLLKIFEGVPRNRRVTAIGVLSVFSAFGVT
jgi:hypothetical protein